jgi:hypothetical protein
VEEVGAEEEWPARPADDHEEEAEDQAGVTVERFSRDTGGGGASELLLLLEGLCLSWGLNVHDRWSGE